MKRKIKLSKIVLFVVCMIQYVDVQCQQYNGKGNYSVGYFGNSGLSNKNTTIPILLGIEKWKSISKKITLGLAEDLSYIQNKDTKNYYIISATKANIHFWIKNNFDLYGGVAYNYLMINQGEGAELFDQYIGYHVGAKFFILKTIGLFAETGKGNYVNFGIVFKQ